MNIIKQTYFVLRFFVLSCFLSWLSRVLRIWGEISLSLFHFHFQWFYSLFVVIVRHASGSSCPKSLCHGKSNGAMYRVDDSNPGYFVQCSNGFAYCVQCPSNLEFDNTLQVCTFPKRGGSGGGGTGHCKLFDLFVCATWFVF